MYKEEIHQLVKIISVVIYNIFTYLVTSSIDILKLYL